MRWKNKKVTCSLILLSRNDNKYQFNCEKEKSFRVNINSSKGKSTNGVNVVNVVLNCNKNAN